MTENALTVLIAALLVNIAFAGVPILRDALAGPERGLARALDWFAARLDRPNRSASSRLTRHRDGRS